MNRYSVKPLKIQLAERLAELRLKQANKQKVVASILNKPKRK